ncbi:hypothetical protein D3C86_2163100 [compost metagenome]
MLEFIHHLLQVLILIRSLAAAALATENAVSVKPLTVAPAAPVAISPVVSEANTFWPTVAAVVVTAQ